MKHYKAPWSMSLIVVSSLVTLLCIGIAINAIGTDRAMSHWAALLPIVIVCGGALFTIRGYTVTSDAILIHRLLWTTRLALAGLQSAQSAPDVMGWSLRTFGNGGLFSFSGFYWNKALGTYRAFVTDPHRTVVLHFHRRTIVVSPAAPEDFVENVCPISNAV